MVQFWEKISSCYIDRLTAVAAIVIITAAATALVTARVTASVSVPGTAPAVIGFVTASVRVSVTVENEKQLGPLYFYFTLLHFALLYFTRETKGGR